jgi:hypothetical protein
MVAIDCRPECIYCCGEEALARADIQSFSLVYFPKKKLACSCVHIYFDMGEFEVMETIQNSAI